MRGVKLLVLLACAATLAGCGLPDQYYLQPPISPATAPGAYFKFSNPDHTKDSNVAFKGYELYYQFYDPTDVTHPIDVNAYDPNSTVDVVTQLMNKGFKPVVSDADSWGAPTVPVIPIDPADMATSFEVHINISAEGNSDLSFTFSPAITIPTDNFLRRDVQNSPTYLSQFKTYYSNAVSGYTGNYAASDADCGLIAGPIAGSGQVYLAMYALSYGLQGISTPIRSIPIYLGYLNLQIN